MIKKKKKILNKVLVLSLFLSFNLFAAKVNVTDPVGLALKVGEIILPIDAPLATNLVVVKKSSVYWNENAKIGDSWGGLGKGNQHLFVHAMMSLAALCFAGCIEC
ncbi:MAG: hypothetical protein PF692_15180 [Kiritimatiellae bacterium]|nr:hypothetical protein [Kiritimatiellia bacterium]